jgi:hypothetical protein
MHPSVRLAYGAFLLSVAGVALGLPSLAAAEPSLANHRALYELRLAKGGGAKAPASANGRIAYDFFSACDVYAQTLRQAVELQPQEGKRQFSESRINTFEDTRGRDFRFAVAENGAPGEEVEGRAQRVGDSGLAIAVSRPKPEKISTDGDVLFPTQHIAKVLEAARRGEKIMLARVFDGSGDGQKVFNVTAIIGAPLRGADPDRGAKAEQLHDLRRWPVSLAYFPEGERDGEPDYVLSYNLYENGVSTGLRLDYGDYVLIGELTRIEFPPAPRCRK